MAARLQGVEALTMEPLTDQELAIFDNWSEEWHGGRDVEPALMASAISRLVAEVRRLRAEVDWRRAAMEQSRQP